MHRVGPSLRCHGLKGALRLRKAQVLATSGASGSRSFCALTTGFAVGASSTGAGGVANGCRGLRIGGNADLCGMIMGKPPSEGNGGILGQPCSRYLKTSIKSDTF